MDRLPSGAVRVYDVGGRRGQDLSQERALQVHMLLYWNQGLMMVANEGTLLLVMFSWANKQGYIFLLTHNDFERNQIQFCISDTNFLSNVARGGKQTGKHICPQQCVIVEIICPRRLLKCSEAFALLKLLYNPRVNKLFTSLYFTRLSPLSDKGGLVS